MMEQNSIGVQMFDLLLCGLSSRLCTLCSWLLLDDFLFLVRFWSSRWQWFRSFNRFAVECSILGCLASQLLVNWCDHTILGAFGETKLETIEISQVCALKLTRSMLNSSFGKDLNYTNLQFALPLHAQPTMFVTIFPWYWSPREPSWRSWLVQWMETWHGIWSNASDWLDIVVVERDVMDHRWGPKMLLNSKRYSMFMDKRRSRSWNEIFRCIEIFSHSFSLHLCIRRLLLWQVHPEE